MLLLIVFPVMPCKLKQNWNRLSLHIPDVCTIMNASFHTCKEGELMQLIIMQVSRGIHYCIHFIRGVYIIVFTLFEGYTLLCWLHSRGIHYCVDFIGESKGVSIKSFLHLIAISLTMPLSSSHYYWRLLFQSHACVVDWHSSHVTYNLHNDHRIYLPLYIIICIRKACIRNQVILLIFLDIYYTHWHLETLPDFVRNSWWFLFSLCTKPQNVLCFVEVQFQFRYPAACLFTV